MPAQELTPATPTPVLVFQYKVPSGLQFEMTDVMFAAITTGMIQAPVNPGDVLYTINRNTPAGATAPQGSPLADFQNVPFSFGSPTQGPIQLRRAENFQANDVVSLYVVNIAAAPGAPNFIVGMFEGWQRKA